MDPWKSPKPYSEQSSTLVITRTIDFLGWKSSDDRRKRLKIKIANEKEIYLKPWDF